MIGPALRWCIDHFDLILFLMDLKKKDINEFTFKQIQKRLWRNVKKQEPSIRLVK